MHAGELEVSLLLHGYPELVDDGYRRGDWEADSRPHLLVTGMRGYTETGVIGRPSLASADKGRAVLESLARSPRRDLGLGSTDVRGELVSPLTRSERASRSLPPAAQRGRQRRRPSRFARPRVWLRL
jgi:Creatinine amidohydrolase